MYTHFDTLCTIHIFSYIAQVKNVFERISGKVHSYVLLKIYYKNILYILLRFSLESCRILADYFKCFLPCSSSDPRWPAATRSFLTSRTVGSWSHWCILRALFKSHSSTGFCSITFASSTFISTASEPRPPFSDCTAAKVKSISCRK